MGEVALVGMPDPVLGERLCAFVAPRVPGSEPSLEELVDVLRSAEVARFTWPERLEIVAGWWWSRWPTSRRSWRARRVSGWRR